MSGRVRWVVLLVLAMLPLASSARAQQLAMAGRRPRFIAAWELPRKAVDASGAATLRRRIALRLKKVSIAAALNEVARLAQLELSYDAAALPPGRTVSITATDVTVIAALTEVLLDAGMDLAVGQDGALTLIPAVRVQVPAASARDSGSVTGTVAERSSGSPVAGASVVLDNDRTTSTNLEGRYVMANVQPGSHTVRVRYIGYATRLASVEVTSGESVTLDFLMDKSVQQLDQVVVTGTVVPTEVKALPSPVTVVSSADIEALQPRTLNEIFRQAVPSGVAWDFSGFPQQTPLSVRGAGSLGGGSSVKVLLDGVELTDAANAAIDPNSIERIEIIRGPEASTIYGSNAIGGVMQVFTKRGDPALRRPQISAQAALGVAQSPYGAIADNGALRQDYSASIRGATSGASYALGGGYRGIGDWVPQGAQSLASTYGSARVSQGPLSVDLSARYYVVHNSTMVAPAATRVWSFLAPPFYGRQTARYQTYGLRASFAPNTWWRNQLTVGLDRYPRGTIQSQPRLTDPTDTLLQVSDFESSKASVAYNTSVLVRFSQMVSADFTAGVDHWGLTNDSYSTDGALSTSGTIRTEANHSPTISHTVTTNTGYFTQAQLRVADALFITGGLRAEQNSDFGEQLGTRVSPRAGVSYVRGLGAATLKLRGSYGEAIRPPAPGQKDAIGAGFGSQRANALLAAERQHGWDAGFDLTFGTRGSVAVTYYRQTALGLIDLVQVEPEQQIYQYQNVGRVKNDGVELEGTLRFGFGQLRAQYAITNSKPEDLGLGYTGDLRVAEQVFLVPRHTGGLSLSLTPHPTTSVTVGLTYVGSWSNYDFLAFFGCLGGTAPCQPGFRDYLTTYPGFVKTNVSVGQAIARNVSGYIAVNNLGNVGKAEAINSTPTMGRVAVMGFEVRY